MRGEIPHHVNVPHHMPQLISLFFFSTRVQGLTSNQNIVGKHIADLSGEKVEMSQADCRLKGMP